MKYLQYQISNTRVNVDLVEKGTLERFEGKTERVSDLRKEL